MYFFDFRIIGLFALLLPATLSAQIGKTYRSVRAEGPIVQMESTQTMIIQNEDGSTKERESTATFRKE